MLYSKLTTTVLAVFAGLAMVSVAPAAVMYSTSGSTYLQEFDSLPNSPTNTSLGNSPNGWIDDTTTPGANQFSIRGWYLDHRTTAAEGGANGKQRFRNGSGNSGTGAFYSFGANGNQERALGSVPSANLAGNGDSMRIGLRLTNGTGKIIDTFTITYDGEQWRDAEGTSSLSFSYGIDLPAATWHTSPSGAVPGSVTFVGAAAFIAPVTNNPGTGVAVNGNVAGRVADITATVNLPSTNLWHPGTDLWLRWSQVQVASTDDDGLAIDNVRFSATVAVPEPTSFVLLGLAGFGLFAARRIR